MTKNYRRRKAKELLEKKLDVFGRQYKVSRPHFEKLVSEIFEMFDSREFKTLIIENKKYEKIREAKESRKQPQINPFTSDGIQK